MISLNDSGIFHTMFYSEEDEKESRHKNITHINCNNAKSDFFLLFFNAYHDTHSILLGVGNNDNKIV